MQTILKQINYTALSESWRMRTNSFLLWDPATIPAFASIFPQPVRAIFHNNKIVNIDG